MRATQFVRSHFNAWNHHDPVAVAEHLSTDGIYIDVPGNLQGSHDGLIVILKEFFATHRHRYELVGEILQGPDTIAFQYLMLPSGHGSPTPEVPIPGSGFMTLNRGVAQRIWWHGSCVGTALTAARLETASPAARSPEGRPPWSCTCGFKAG